MMRRLAMLVMAVALSCLPAAAQTADEIIAKNVAARGGLKKFHKLKTMTITGRLVGPGMDAPITVQLKRSNKFRMDFIVQGKTITRGYDGSSGWQVMPFGEKVDPQPLTGDELKNIQDEADFDGPLVDCKAKGHQAEFVGKENINQTACYKLKLTLKTGHVMYQYLDAESGMEIREELIRPINGKETEIEESVGNYKKVDHILFPHEFDSNTKGSTDRYKLILEKIELNRKIPDDIFKMPQTKPTS